MFEENILTLLGLTHFKKNADETYSNKPTKISATLLASNWTSEVVPYRIEISVEGLTENTDVQVVPNYDWTDEQVNTWMNAQVISGETSDGILSLKAYGEKPTIDLPITLLVGSEII